MNRNPDTDITIDSDEKLHSGGNDPALTEQFRDFGLGMFIHFSVDSTVNTVISHWMIGTDKRIVDDFIDNYPARFRIEDFDPSRWAALAQQAGAKYAVLTAKHHNGFCMWNTQTTPFNIMSSGFGRDLLGEYFAAFREYGIQPGLYFSPLDFYYNHRMKHRLLQFATPDMLQENDPEMLDYNNRQIEELTTRYGDVYCMFFDGPPDSLKQTVWGNQPRCLITRGEMDTPENVLPTEVIPHAWEACYMLGGSWGYMPADPTSHDAGRVVKNLIKIRARGGNLLINVSPDSHGKIPVWQEEMLQQLGLFNFFNSEAIYGVRPYDVICEEDESVFYSRSKDGKTVYAYVMDGIPHYGYNGRHKITLKKLAADGDIKIRMVGSDNTVMEHRPGTDCANYCKQTADGLVIDCILSMRPTENRKWTMPVVFALEGVKPITQEE